MKTNEEVTKKNIINKRKIIISILLFAIIVYSIIVVYKLIGNPVDNFFVENGEITFEESTEGYIIRDETIVEGNNYKNGIAQIKSEGDKVAKGESIFRYYSNNEEDLTKKIKDLWSRKRQKQYFCPNIPQKWEYY